MTGRSAGTLTLKIFATMNLLILFLASFFGPSTQMLFQTNRRNRPATCPRILSREQLTHLSTRTSNMADFRNRLLPNILIERVPGTPGSSQVRDFIVKEMESLRWYVELDSFIDQTPYGLRNFTNIIATANPNSPEKVVVACHYDSKIFPGPTVFLGATDSAVPCSIMLQTARQLSWNTRLLANNRLSLQFIFFDGEEAFREWKDNDNTYGSRHLAAKWEAQSPYKLRNIKLFILLDLIGTVDTSFQNIYQNTQNYFYSLAQTEHCLTASNLLSSRYMRPLFKNQFYNGEVADDHLPFLRRGVPILHLISLPFPRVWHTLHDNLQSLDFTLIDDFSKIFRVFIASVMLQG